MLAPKTIIASSPFLALQFLPGTIGKLDEPTLPIKNLGKVYKSFSRPRKKLLAVLFVTHGCIVPPSVPRAGNTNSGEVWNGGYDGNYWSSTVYNANNAYNLNFYSTNVNPENNNNRNNGFSVRCVAR